jgi:hypothetical protein
VVRVENGPDLVRSTVGCDPGRPFLAPPDEDDLHLTEADARLFRRLAQEQGLFSLQPEDALSAVARYFREGFTYSLYQEQDRAGSAMEHFLEKRRAGHCELFATATVLLLRAARIPARYGVGCAVREYSRLEGCYLARRRHAHAWALAWVDGAWRVADFTPSSWLQAEAEARSPLEPLLDLWRMAAYRFERWRWREGGAHLPLGLVGLAAGLVPLLVWRIVRRRDAIRGDRKERPAEPSPGPEGRVWAFQRIERALEARGLPRRAGETAAQWAVRLENALGSEGLSRDLQPMLALYYRLRFDPEGGGKGLEIELQRQVDDWLSRFETDQRAESPRFSR